MVKVSALPGATEPAKVRLPKPRLEQVKTKATTEVVLMKPYLVPGIAFFLMMCLGNFIEGNPIHWVINFVVVASFICLTFYYDQRK